MRANSTKEEIVKASEELMLVSERRLENVSRKQTMWNVSFILDQEIEGKGGTISWENRTNSVGVERGLLARLPALSELERVVGRDGDEAGRVLVEIVAREELDHEGLGGSGSSDTMKNVTALPTDYLVAFPSKRESRAEAMGSEKKEKRGEQKERRRGKRVKVEVRGEMHEEEAHPKTWPPL